MRRRRAVAAAVLTALVVGIAALLSSGGAPTTGYDASFPQCPSSVPAHPLFGIVGVNGGRANTANPCLRDELTWARGAPGQRAPDQPALSLYINTGNPGGHPVSDFPRSGVAAPYGVCNGKLTDACSYLYGQARARYSYHLVAAAAPGAARAAPWWLDVELMATWAGTYELNIAALRGFINGLRRAGATGPIGIYSTAAQWRDITGLTAVTTPAAFHGALRDWVAGTTATERQAQANCQRGGFTGLAPTLAQYRVGPFDADLRCPAT